MHPNGQASAMESNERHSKSLREQPSANLAPGLDRLLQTGAYHLDRPTARSVLISLINTPTADWTGPAGGVVVGEAHGPNANLGSQPASANLGGDEDSRPSGAPSGAAHWLLPPTARHGSHLALAVGFRVQGVGRPFGRADGQLGLAAAAWTWDGRRR